MQINEDNGIERGLDVVNEEQPCDKLKLLASLINKEESQVVDECCLFEIRQLMSKISKVVVRYSLNDVDIDKLVYNCNKLGIGEIIVSSVYLQTLIRLVKKNDMQSQKLGVIIDFPFGESLFKSKLLDLRNSLRMGIKNIVVVMPSILINVKNVKTLKRQIKYLGRIKKGEVGIAVNVNDLSEEQIKLAFKVANKSKIKGVTLTFGKTDRAQFENKMKIVNECKGEKQVKVLADVDSIEGVWELNCLDINGIMSPYADDIGYKIIKRFNVQCVKFK